MEHLRGSARHRGAFEIFLKKVAKLFFCFLSYMEMFLKSSRANEKNGGKTSAGRIFQEEGAESAKKKEGENRKET